MDNRQVAHLWANRSRPSAKGSNFYFEGPILYSYGQHFPVGAFVDALDGVPTALLNSRTYSPTTQRHQSYAASAIPPGVRVFSVPSPVERYGRTPDHDANLAAYAKRHREACEGIGKIRRATKTHTREERQTLAALEADSILSEWLSYAGAFGLTPPDARPFAESPDYADRVNAVRDAQRVQEAQRLASIAECERLEAAKRAADAEAFALWQAGTGPLPASWRRIHPQRMRVREGLVETTGGAVVPVESVRGIVGPLLAARAAGKPLDRFTGERVGDFTIHETDPEGVRVGCHYFAWGEVEALAARLA